MKLTRAQQNLKLALENGEIREDQLNLYKKIANSGNKELFDLMRDAHREHGYVSLTQDQVKKGFDWLMDQWKTPFGKERKNNPFGFREQEILDDFLTIEFEYFYDAGRFNSCYLPVYRVMAKDQSSTFEYYVNGGRIEIIG